MIEIPENVSVVAISVILVCCLVIFIASLAGIFDDVEASNIICLVMAVIIIVVLTVFSETYKPETEIIKDYMNDKYKVTILGEYQDSLPTDTIVVRK